MAIAKLAFVFAIVAWYRGDWVHAQLRRHARVFGDALARLGVGVRGTDPVSYTHLTLPTTPYV